MKLIISNVSGVPIYEQIKQQIKAAILVEKDDAFLRKLNAGKKVSGFVRNPHSTMFRTLSLRFSR